jgi:hypothetical protein
MLPLQDVADRFAARNTRHDKKTDVAAEFAILRSLHGSNVLFFCMILDGRPNIVNNLKTIC